MLHRIPERRFSSFNSRIPKLANVNKFVSSTEDLGSPKTEQDEKQDSHQQSTTTSSNPQFQDERIKLACFGHCGSEINKLLVQETNLKYFERVKRMPRVVSIQQGLESKEFYQKLKFFEENRKENEEKFINLLISFMKNQANRLSMGLKNTRITPRHL